MDSLVRLGFLVEGCCGRYWKCIRVIEWGVGLLMLRVEGWSGVLSVKGCVKVGIGGSGICYVLRVLYGVYFFGEEFLGVGV